MKRRRLTQAELEDELRRAAPSLRVGRLDDSGQPIGGGRLIARLDTSAPPMVVRTPPRRRWWMRGWRR